MKIEIKKALPCIVIPALTVLIFLFSLCMYIAKGYGKKYVSIFPSVDEGKYVLETRYLKSNPVKEPLHYFADELVLGSGLERTKYLFSPGTKILSCFERNNVVYIDLSADIIHMGDNVMEIRDGIELLKKNITRNFPHTEEIKVCVDGKYAFE